LELGVNVKPFDELWDSEITLIYRDSCPVSHLFLKGTIGWCERFVQKIVSGEVIETVIKERDLLGCKGIKRPVASGLDVEIIFDERELLFHGESGVGLDPDAIKCR
jgi:hypothetical protein